MASNVTTGFAFTSVLLCSFAMGQEVNPDSSTGDGEADGFWRGDPPPFEYSAEVQSLIREAGCRIEDEQCKQVVAVRYALRLPEGFSKEPNCAADTVCVSETLSMRHDDFVAVLELVSPQIQPDWVNISMQGVMVGIVVVTAESDRGSTGGGIGFIDGGTFLVERESPIGNWSILRGQVYTKDFVEVDADEDRAER